MAYVRPSSAVGFLLFVVAGPTGCMIAGIVHPGKTEVGGGVSVVPPPGIGASAPGRDLRFATGIHVASLTTSRRIPFDVGAGYVRMSSPDAKDVWHPIRGAYVEVAPVVLRGDVWRVFAGPRAELLFAGDGDRGTGFAMFGRVAWETYAPVAFAGGTASGKACFAAVGYGALGLSPYTEAGLQRLPGGDVTTVVLGGLSVRHPAAAFCAGVTK